MNDDVPARDAEGQTSFYAGKSALSLNAKPRLSCSMALSHIVPRQLDEEIPRDDSIEEVEARDQGVPVVRIPELYAHLFRIRTEISAIARSSDQSIKVIKEKSVAVIDCGASQTITSSLINCTT
jgi:hypothetical protein